MNFYNILDITPEASSDEIKKSFRRLAKQYHPDVCQEKDAENRFKLIYIAYEILSDSYKREIYDELQILRQAEENLRMRIWKEHADRQAQTYADMNYSYFENKVLSALKFHTSQGLGFLFGFVLMVLGFGTLIMGSEFVFQPANSTPAGYLIWAFGLTFLFAGGKTLLDVLRLWRE